MFTVLQLLGLRPRTVFDSGVIGVHELSFHKLDSERRFACRENILMYHTVCKVFTDRSEMPLVASGMNILHNSKRGPPELRFKMS